MHRRDQFRRRLRQQLERLERLPLQVEEARLDLRRTRRRLRNVQHARRQERPARQEFEDAEALHALADEVMAAVRCGDVAHDIGDRADPVQVVGSGIGDLGVALQQDADLAAARAPPAARRRSISAGRA